MTLTEASVKAKGRSAATPPVAQPHWSLGAALAIVFLALFAGLSFWEMVGDSVTSDEVLKEVLAWMPNLSQKNRAL